jgi:phage minor structural protein
MINVYSPTETNFKNNGLATLIPISCDYGIGINDKWQLTMEHPFDKELRYQHLVEDAILRVTGFSCVNEQEQDTNRFGLNGKVQLFRVFDTKKTLTSVTVIAFPVALEAVYDTPIENLVIQNKTGIEAGEILDAQTQKYSVSSDITRTASSKYENTNLIGAISGNNDDSYVKKWGGEVVYDNNKIKIRNKIGDQSNASAYPIRYGRNLTGLTHEIDMSSVVTRMFPISSDDLRLNVWEDVTSQGGNRYVDSPDHISDYPFIRCLFVQVDYSLLDTDSNSISETATATNGWKEGIINAVTAQATALWTSIIQDLTNTYSPEYIQDLISGEDGIVGYLQKKYVYSHKGWQSFVKSCVKQGVEWIKSEELPTWEWHEDTSVIPHAWWYGDNSVSPAVSYAKNEYVKIGKNYEYFNNDGFWEDYKAMPHADCDWYEAQDGSGRKWFGYRKGYYAHNEYVYMTVEGQMKEWWYDEEGWYDESRSGDSDMGWHGDASSGFWFGESDATSEDTNKFLHDRWAWIDGNYYWFDKYGYISGELDIPDYPWFVIETTQGSWFGNDQDEMLGAKWFANQWAKIDGEWYYFDADGYVVDMTAKQSETIAWFANTVYNNTIEYITTCLTNAYTLLYRLMREWCEKQYADGIDLPTVNVSVDLIDLSKTTEYKDYSNLEKISLGDKVLVIGRDGSRYEERVVGLTFDCIRGYNTRVEVGQLSKSVSQIINVSYSGASEGQKIIAGDGVTIDGKVISVGDYVGRTIGLQDVLLNGSTTVSGNVASFGIQAGENISISRDGNTLTINSTGGDGDVNLYHGIDIPYNSLGDEKDIYLQMESAVGNLLSFDASHSGTSITNYSATETNRKWDITATFVDNWEYHSFNIYSLQNLTVGKKYAISFDFQNDGTPPLYGIGELFGLTLQHSNRFIDMRNWSSDLVENGEFKYFADSYYGEWWYQSFPNDTKRRHYEFEFTARQTTEYIGFYGDRTSGNLTCSLYELCVGDRTETNEIKDVFYKVNGEWLLYDGGESYEAGENITIADGVISATDTDEIAELEDVNLTNLADGEILKYNATTQKWENAEDSGGSEVEANPSGTATDTLTKLGIDGTIYEIQGGGGGGSTYFGVFVDANNVIQPFVNISDTQIHTYTAIKDCAVAYYIPNDANTDVFIKLDGIQVGGQYGEHINATSGIVYMKKGQVFSYQSTYSASSGAGYTVYGLQSGSEASYFQPIIYSTEEREVGVWIDNKPLYARSFTLSSQITVSASSWTNTDLSISDVEKFVNGYAISDDGIFQGSVVIDKSNDIIQLQSTRSSASYVKYLTVFYTKTTDVAGSGSYTTLGVPAHHYDGNEKVVGTWFGETLYENCIDLGSVTQITSNGVQINIGSIDVKQPINAFGIYDLTIAEAQTIPLLWFKYNGNMYFSSSTTAGCNKLILQYTKTS